MEQRLKEDIEFERRTRKALESYEKEKGDHISFNSVGELIEDLCHNIVSKPRKV